MIKVVVTLEFADESFHFAAPVVEVEDGVSVLFLERDIGGNDPVVVVTLEEVGLVCGVTV